MYLDKEQIQQRKISPKQLKKQKEKPTKPLQ